MTGQAPTAGRVAVLTAPEQFELRAMASPQPAAGEVVVRVAECGICGSDLKMWAGTHAFMRPPIVMGHEIVGSVEAVGAGVELEQGVPVTIFPPIGCGHCFHCLNGNEQLCKDMVFVGGQVAGGLAAYVVVPASHVLPIPAGVPEALRVLIEPLSVALHGVSRGAPQAGERAVVIGAGAIGLFTTLVLRGRGVEVVIAEPREARRQRAANLGLVTVDPNQEELVDAVARLIRPEGADVVFECVGSQATINAGLEATRKGGRTVIVGNAPESLTVDGMSLQRGDRSLVGVLMYEIGDFRTAMRLLEDGIFDGIAPDELVAHYALDRALDAFRDAKNGGLTALKAVLVP